MLKDIILDTKWVLDQFVVENKTVTNKKSVYDLYRALQKVISNVNLVSEHYLALDFTEEYLQESSIGEASDKWRYFLNKDLKSLNKSLKKYLMKLDSVFAYDKNKFSQSYLSTKYNAKEFYGFVRDNYNVGIVKPCGFEMICTILNTDSKSEENLYIEKFAKIDLSTYEKRLALQTALRKRNDTLKKELERIKNYIQSNFVLEDLL